MRRRILGQIVIAMVVCGVSLSHAQISANATRPSASDNAYLAFPGYLELELGWAGGENSVWMIPALLKFAYSDRVELSFIMQGVLNHNSDTEIGDPGGQLKLQIGEGQWGALALVAQGVWRSSDAATYTGYGVASFQQAQFQADITAGVSVSDRTGGSETYFPYAVAVAPKVRGPLSPFGEVFGQFGDSEALSAGGGLSYKHSPGFVSDVGLAIGLSGDASDFLFQIGFTSTLTQLR